MLPPTQIHILNLRVEVGLLCILLQNLNINYGIAKETYGLCATDALLNKSVYPTELLINPFTILQLLPPL
jgi:hypothetical protein